MGLFAVARRWRVMTLVVLFLVLAKGLESVFLATHERGEGEVLLFGLIYIIGSIVFSIYAAIELLTRD